MITHLFTRPLRPLFVALVAMLAAGCMLVESKRDLPGDSAPRGYVRLSLAFAQSQTVLAKAAAGDTTFQLDSLIIVFTASGASDVRMAQAISGRPDTGVISVQIPPVELPGLRNWTARVYTIDDRVVYRDTVHLDSVTFAVLPADTAVVQKTVSPAFAVLKVRVVSNTDSLVPDSVRFIRLRVDDVVRDSMVVGSAPPTARLNWVQAMPTGNVVHAVGNHGRVLRSTNSGLTWTEITIPGEPQLIAGHFVDANNGFIISRTGRIYATTNGGVPSNNWPQLGWVVNDNRQPTPDSVNAFFMTGGTTGFAVGRNGGLYKTNNAGQSWFVNVVSNTSENLNAVHFPTPNVGYVVGENETILRTVKGGEGDNPPPNGVIWKPMAGGWFFQTSNEASRDFQALAFWNQDIIWAAGKNGLLRYTTDGGTIWNTPNVGAAAGRNLNAIAYANGWDKVFAVTDGGVILKSGSNQNDWQIQTGSGANGTGTTRNLRGIVIVGNNRDTGYVVGDGGTILRSVNANQTSWPYVTWQAQSLPGGDTTHLRSVFAMSSHVVFVAGNNGRIAKTSNAGAAWTFISTPVSDHLNEIRFVSSLVGWAVGTGGTVLKTVDGGANWNKQAIATTKEIRSVYAISVDTAFVVGVDGEIFKTVNGGSQWVKQIPSTGTGTLNRVVFWNSSIGLAVGNGGKILNAINQGDNWTGGGVKRALKGVFFVSASTGWVVGDDGVILKTTDSARTWVEQHRQNGLMLHAVHFQNANTGWVTGANGEVFKTTNGGATWVQQTTIVTTIPLTWISFRNTSDGFIIGGTNSLYRTSNGGTSWEALFAGGLPGARIFNEVLSYKYLKPGQSHKILVEAIDRASPLRGYQAEFLVTVGAGKDTTVTRSLAPCGRAPYSDCK